MSDAKTPESGGTKGTSPKAIIAGVCAAAVVVTGGALYATGVIGPKEEDPGLKYATEGVVVMSDSDGIYDELIADEAIALEFKNDAYSVDGQTFKCYVGNSPINQYDMFLIIYADPEMTDLICTTGLVIPGNAFEVLTLDRALEPGDHMVYVAYTQVTDPETIHAQTFHTMDFHVKEES